MSVKKKSAPKSNGTPVRPETAREKVRPDYLGAYRVFVPSQQYYNQQRPKTDKKDFNNLRTNQYRNPLPDQFISNATRADKS